MSAESGPEEAPAGGGEADKSESRPAMDFRDPAGMADSIAREVYGRLQRGLVGGVRGGVHGVEGALKPAWQRLTQGEPRWQVAVAGCAALAMQATLPEDLVLGPNWLLPSLGAVVLAAVVIANPGRVDKVSKALRIGALVLIGVISLANAGSAARLITGLVDGTDHKTARDLLMAGGAIWLTNVIIFAMWYWEFDRGGPAARAMGERDMPDFLFPQMASPELAPAHWEPRFVDYLYLSFTNATAFSPTDVMPLSRWTKIVMLAQSLVSLVTVALVIARAVNILK